MNPAAYGLKRFDISAGRTSIVAIVVSDTTLQLPCCAGGYSRYDLVDIEVLDLVIDVDGIRVKKSWVVEGRENGLAEQFFRGEAIFIWTAGW